jgi:hypothetical protein
VPTVSNVRQDLNEWQARHATHVLSAVKVFSSCNISQSPDIIVWCAFASLEMEICANVDILEKNPSMN